MVSTLQWKAADTQHFSRVLTEGLHSRPASSSGRTSAALAARMEDPAPGTEESLTERWMETLDATGVGHDPSETKERNESKKQPKSTQGDEFIHQDSKRPPSKGTRRNSQYLNSSSVCVCVRARVSSSHVAPVDAQLHHDPLWSLPFQGHLRCPPPDP